MWINDLIRSIIETSRSPVIRMLLLSAFYLAIIVALVVMYGKGALASTDFVYQGF